MENMKDLARIINAANRHQARLRVPASAIIKLIIKNHYIAFPDLPSYLKWKSRICGE